MLKFHRMTFLQFLDQRIIMENSSCKLVFIFLFKNIRFWEITTDIFSLWARLFFDNRKNSCQLLVKFIMFWRIGTSRCILTSILDAFPKTWSQWSWWPKIRSWWSFLPLFHEIVDLIDMIFSHFLNNSFVVEHLFCFGFYDCIFSFNLLFENVVIAF